MLLLLPHPSYNCPAQQANGLSAEWLVSHCHTKWPTTAYLLITYTAIDKNDVSVWWLQRNSKNHPCVLSSCLAFLDSQKGRFKQLVFVCLKACVNLISFKADVPALAIRPCWERHWHSRHHDTCLYWSLHVLCIDAFNGDAHETDGGKNRCALFCESKALTGSMTGS